VRRLPATPLLAIDWPKVAIGARPLVPYGNAALLQPSCVGFAAQEPEQFIDDRLQVQSLGGEQRKPAVERRPHLEAERGECAYAGSVRFVFAMLKDMLKMIQILAF